MNILEIGNLSNFEKEQIMNRPRQFKLTVPSTEYWNKLLKDLDMSVKNPCIIEFSYNKIKYMAQVSRITKVTNTRHMTFKGKPIKSGPAFVFNFGKSETRDWFYKSGFIKE